MRHARNALAGLLLLSVFATSVPSASAAGYDVEVCTPRATKGEGVFPNTSGSAPPTYAPCGSAPEGAIRLAAGARSPGGTPLSGLAQWSLQAPPQTSIVSLFTERFFNSLRDSGLVWEVLTPSGLRLDRTVAEGQMPPAGGNIEYPVHSTKLTARLSCPTAACQPDRTPPSLSGVSLSRKRFKAAAGGNLTFTSSEPAQVSVTIERLRGAHKPLRVATLSTSVAAGRTTLAIGGRSGKRLAPGSYRLTIVARDAAGNASQPLRRAFSVSPR